MTNAGSKYLKPLTNLRILRLGIKDLTDATLKNLSALKNLEELSIQECRVTRAEMTSLERALPNLTKIEWVHHP